MVLSSVNSWRWILKRVEQMDISIPSVAVALFFLLVLVKLVIRGYTTPPSGTKAPSSHLRLPPGPWQLPLIGSLHHLLLSRFSDLPHRALREMSATYGPVMLLRFGSVDTVVASTAEAAREVMRTHDLTFSSRHLSVTMDIISCGGKDIIFSPYNDRWRELRKLCMVELLNQRRVLSFRGVREDEVANLIRRVSGECGAAAVDLSRAVCRMVNDVAVRTAIGDRCRYQDEYLRELDEVVRLMGGFNLADLYPSSRLARRFSAAARDMAKCQRNIYRIIQSIIQERRAVAGAGSPTTTPEHQQRQEDLLDVLLRLQREGGLQFALTDEIVSTVIFDIFSAGSETSSTVLVWAMSELVKNPQVMQKAQSEVREAFKGQDKVSEGDLVKLRYLHLVIKEALRLHAPVPLLLPRECREACQVLGYDVPKGTKVIVNAWAIARDKNSWWPDAEEFRPERFDGSGVDFKGMDMEFTPFGAGRRMCPGIMLGLANLELALASLLYHFDWEMPDGGRPEELDVAEAFGITLRKKTSLVLRAKPRTSFVSN